MSRARALDIAIIGMGCRFPGAPDLCAFWETVLAGRCQIADVPDDRWPQETFVDAHSTANDRVPNGRGGRLESPIAFPAAEHGVMPRTVEGGEPEQFLMLEAAMAALDDSGIAPERLKGRRVDVVVGRGNYFNRGNLTRFQHGRGVEQALEVLSAVCPAALGEAGRDTLRERLKRGLPPFEAATIAGQLTNAVAGRIAHRLDLNGTAFAIDAASASALVALELAARSLADRRAELAIAGAAYVEADVDFPLVFQQLGALSPSGNVRPFAADADGLLSGEGVGALILKRLADAERDGDRVYAIVRAVGLASDGRSSGLTAPSTRGHARAMRRAYRQSGIDPGSVMLVEGHGLGVPAADRAELRALNAVFPAPRHGKRSLGAVSALIGHAMPASGMAGLIKSALAIYHGVLPPSPIDDNPHSLLDPAKSPFALDHQARPWIHPDGGPPRRAAVNAFGFAGANAHAVLEEHTTRAAAPRTGRLERREAGSHTRPAVSHGAPLCPPFVRGEGDQAARPHAPPLRRGDTGGSACNGPGTSATQPFPALPPRTSTALRNDTNEPMSRTRSNTSGGFRCWPSEAVLLSAPDRPALAERARALVDWLSRHSDAPLKDVAHTLGREAANAPAASARQRLGIVAESIDDLVRRLDAVIARLSGPPEARAANGAGHGSGAGDGRGIYQWDEPLLLSSGEETTRGLAFLFPGEGSQYPGMLADLCFQFPEVRRQFDTADRIARELSAGAAVPPSEHVFGRSSASGDALWSPVTAVNVVLNAQWALFQLLARLNASPSAVAGHSSGEILALAAAEALQIDGELEHHLARLGSVFSAFESNGELLEARLIAVAADRERVEALRREPGLAGLDVAIDNCPHQVVLVGVPEVVERLVPRLRAEQILFEELPFGRPYHTPRFAPVLGPVAELFEKLTFRRPRLPIYSCATRGRMPEDPSAVRTLAIEQWTRTVAFRETVETMHADGFRVFVDVGARGNLANFAQDTLRGRPAFAIAANLPRRSGLTQLNHLAAALFAQGAPIDVGHLHAHRRPEIIDWNAPPRQARATVAIQLGFPAFEPPTTIVEGRSMPTVQAPAPAPPSRPQPSGPDYQAPTSNVAAAPRLEIAVAPEGASSRLGSDRLNGSMGPADDVFDLFENGPPFAEEGGRGAEAGAEGALLAFQETMRAFLSTQHQVVSAWMNDDNRELGPETIHDAPAQRLGPVPGPIRSPGPWAGETRVLVPGEQVDLVRWIDQRGDPIAENHTLGGRRVSAVDPSLKGLPVLPFAVMAEMAAQTAALVVAPGRALTGLRDVHAHKWVRYEDAPVLLELRGRRVRAEANAEAETGERVWVGIYNRGTDGQANAPRPVFEALAVFDEADEASTHATFGALVDPVASRFTAESLYDEQWLFHGPPFQALTCVGAVSDEGIDGALRVMPWGPLIEAGRPPDLHIDAIVLDNFTHLLGCWGLDRLAEGGDVVFPLGMAELQIFGKRPPVGTEVACRIRVREAQRHRLRVDAEILRPDGTVWMRLRGWEDWRFHWPSRYRDVFRNPRDVFVGEPLDLGPAFHAEIGKAAAVWLAPPADMGRPVWRDVLEQIQLAPDERAAHLAKGGTERERAHRLWETIAIKEAARRLWANAGRPAVYPADLIVSSHERGRARIELLRENDPDDCPAPTIAAAHADGVALAIATLGPNVRLGVGASRIDARGPGELEAEEKIGALSAGERALLERFPASARPEWAARFRSARTAAARAWGLGVGHDDRAPEIAGVEEHNGVVWVARGASGDGTETSSARASRFRVATARRGDHGWAWALDRQRGGERS